MNQTPVRAIGYIRVSTEDQATSGLGLAAQRAVIAAEVSRRGWELVSVVSDAGVSGKVAPEDRDGLSSALSLLESGGAEVLVCSKLDRLTRSVEALVRLLDRSQRRGYGLVLLDCDVDTTTAGGRLVASVLGSVSEWERNVIGERTRAALGAKKAAGARLGRPVLLNHQTKARIVAMHRSGESMSRIARTLNDEGVATATGRGRWWPATIGQVLETVRLDAEAASARGEPK